MKKTAVAVIAACAGALSALAATTNVYHVAEGETKSMSDFNYELKNGDCIRKTGKGTLNGIPFTNSVDILIEEGVFFFDRAEGQITGGGRELTVKRGATLNFTAEKGGAFSGTWTIRLAGNGTGKGDNLGALAVGGSIQNNTFGLNTKWILEDDTTIYTYGSHNAAFSGPNSNTKYCELTMNWHKLTLLGSYTRSSPPVFRPRYGLKIIKPGPIVADYIEFARQKDTSNDPAKHDFGSGVPEMSVVNGSKLHAYSDGSIWSYVNSFRFEDGTTMGKGTWSPDSPTLTMKKISGPATISDTALTVSQELAVDGADLVKEGAYNKSLHVLKTLAFSDGCKVSISKPGLLSLSEGSSYVIATAEEGISGMPVLTEEAAEYFTISLARENKDLVITAKANSVVPLLPGAANAAENTAMLASFQISDGSTWLLPSGDFYFSGNTVELPQGTGANVKLMAAEGAECVFNASMTIGAFSNLTLQNITFKGTPGPAIFANGTQGLTLDGCKLVGVVGAYTAGTETKNVPYVFTDVTDLRVLNPVYDSNTEVSPLWTDTAHFEGGTQTADSRVRPGEVVGYVASGMSNQKDLFEAQNHIPRTALAGKKLRLIGGGEYQQAWSINDTGIERLVVAEGSKYTGKQDSNFGPAGKNIHVEPGSCLTLNSDFNKINLNNRWIYIAGTGRKADEPAVRFTGSVSWQKTDSCKWCLTGDATMYDNINEFDNGQFLRSRFRMNGHELTLKNGKFRFGRVCRWEGGGSVIADGTTITASTITETVELPGSSPVMEEGVGYSVEDDKGAPLLTLKNGSVFTPDTIELQKLFSRIVFEPGTCLRYNEKGTPDIPETYTPDFTFATIEGFPTLDGTGARGAANERITSLTVTENYTMRVAEIMDGRKLAMSGEFRFGEGCTLTLKADELAPPEGRYPVIEAEAGITGAKPKLDAASKALGWRLTYSDDRKTLYAGRGYAFVFGIR